MAVITNIVTANPQWPAFGNSHNIEAGFARPADTTIYTAGDVISDSASVAKAIVLPGAGRSGEILGMMLVVGETSTADYDVLLFDSEPTNHLDNAPLTLVKNDVGKLVAYYSFADASKRLVGSSLHVYRAQGPLGDQMSMPFAYSTVNGNLYALLVTRSAQTPASITEYYIKCYIRNA